MSRRFKSKTSAFFAAFVGALCISAILILVWYGFAGGNFIRNSIQTSTSILATPFHVTHQQILEEAGRPEESDHAYWWLNSGGRLLIQNDGAQTLQGRSPEDLSWRIRYAKSNPIDTQNGYFPQNIFRFVSRAVWRDVREQVYFKINALNLLESPQRNASNGLLLMSRYQDHNNLYYAGIRVDGNAVIKKKIGGIYYTMAIKQLFGPFLYNRQNNPNILPLDIWLGLREEVVTLPDGSVRLRLLVDKGKTDTWTLVLEAIDNGKGLGGRVLTEPASVGIRTDFMDVEFENYKVEAL